MNREHRLRATALGDDQGAAPSRTAMLAALARGLLRMEATPPWVLDDAFALVLVGPVWQELHGRVFSQFPIFEYHDGLHDT